MRPPAAGSALGFQQRPHRGPVREVRLGWGGKSGALRAATFGVNDGVVSNLSLIMGVAGGGVSREVLLLAGVAGLIAGAFSMAAGEYISMRFQREMFEHALHMEAHELHEDPEGERRELEEIYRSKGMPPALASEVAGTLMADPQSAIETHAREELGLDPAMLGSPWNAALASLATFALGAFIPLAPFLFASGGTAAAWSVAASGVCLLIVGGAMTLVTGRPFWLSGLRMVAIAGSAASVTYGVGRLLGVGLSA